MKKEELSHRYELPFVRERAFGKPLGTCGLFRFQNFGK